MCIYANGTQYTCFFPSLITIIATEIKSTPDLVQWTECMSARWLQSCRFNAEWYFFSSLDRQPGQHAEAAELQDTCFSKSCNKLQARRDFYFIGDVL